MYHVPVIKEDFFQTNCFVASGSESYCTVGRDQQVVVKSYTVSLVDSQTK